MTLRSVVEIRKCFPPAEVVYPVDDLLEFAAVIEGVVQVRHAVKPVV